MRQPNPKTLKLTSLSLALVAVVVGCTTTDLPAPEMPDITPVEPQPATEPSEDEIFHEALHWSRNSAEHRAIYEQTFKVALERLKELTEGKEPGTWAISSDADETLIDNSLYEIENKKRGESFSDESWGAWVLRKEAVALPGAIDFTNAVKNMGGVVAVVTNRKSHRCEASADNLRSIGVVFDVVLCRHGVREKDPRWDALRSGRVSDWPEAQLNRPEPLPPLEVVMWLGDNIGDFPLLSQDVRKQSRLPEEFGDRYFVLPNPMYGSWEDNPKQ